MKKPLTSFVLVSLLGLQTLGGAAYAQDAGGPNGLSTPQPGVPTFSNPGPDAPSPLTGELVPLPGPPPEGKAAEIKLPDCAPPNCGVPQIMAP